MDSRSIRHRQSASAAGPDHGRHHVDHPATRTAHMAFSGQTLENPASGERITFRATAAETDGELVAIDLELPAGRRVPGPLHVHPQAGGALRGARGHDALPMGRTRIVAGPARSSSCRPAWRTTSRTPATRRARPRRDPPGAADGADVRDRGRARRPGTHDARRHPQAARPRDLRARVRRRGPCAPFPPRWLQRVALAPLAWLAAPAGVPGSASRSCRRRRPTIGLLQR